MSLNGITLTTLFELAQDHDFHQRALAAHAGTEEDLSKMKSRASTFLKNLKWKVIEEDIKKKSLELLHIDAMELLTKAWRQYQEIAEEAEKTKSGGEAAHVALAEHFINAKLHPFLEIDIKKISVEKIVFDVNVDFNLKGLQLKIENGRIVEVEAGSCEGNGEIKVKDTQLVHKDFGPIDMPGKISLGNGIPVV